MGQNSSKAKVWLIDSEIIKSIIPTNDKDFWQLPDCYDSSILDGWPCLNHVQRFLPAFLKHACFIECIIRYPCLTNLWTCLSISVVEISNGRWNWETIRAIKCSPGAMKLLSWLKRADWIHTLMRVNPVWREKCSYYRLFINYLNEEL